VMTLPVEKRINTELFVDERTALYIQKGSFKKVRVKMLAPRPITGGNEKPYRQPVLK